MTVEMILGFIAGLLVVICVVLGQINHELRTIRKRGSYYTLR